MMYKRKVGMTLICCFILLLLLYLHNEKVFAEAENELPKGDILIVYSDGISTQDMKKVTTLVGELTYQSFQVTYAPASDCIGQLHNFKDILLYRVERFPESLLKELQERETIGNSILKERERIKNSSGVSDVRLMFIGNELLGAYLQQTKRQWEYKDIVKQVGKVKYSFDTDTTREVLTKEKDFMFLTGELDNSTGTVIVDDYSGYFCARKGALYHIPITDISDNIIKAALSKEVSSWKWPYNGEPHIYAQYMTINKVYPYQDPDKLLEIIKYMINKKEPFIISVMPVYVNGDFPAMQHFCEVLRFAQANGGVILMHSPINQMTKFDKDLINEYITSAVQIYMDQGVYPMGLQVPQNWIYNSDTIDIIGRFRTILIDDTWDTQIQIEDNNTNLVYRDGHQWIAPAISLDAEEISYLKTYSTAVYFDMTKDMEVIEKKVQACITSEVPLKSLWDIEHSFWTNEDKMSYCNHIILINGKQIKNEFVATEYDQNFRYNRNMLQRFSANLASENRKLIVMVVIISMLFIGFILLARHRNRKRFFQKDDKITKGVKNTHR